MKILFTFFLTSIFFTPATNSGNMDDLIQGLKTGNAVEISKFFDEAVELSLPAASNRYSKNQGEIILKNFFQTAHVKSFDVLHKGENAAAQFCIGNLNTTSGRFRTTVFLKQKGARHIVQEIRIEPN